MKKKPLIILTGPTAVGKTKALPSDLQKQLTARLFLLTRCRFTGIWISVLRRSKPEEMEGIPHHLIDCTGAG